MKTKTKFIFQNYVDKGNKITAPYQRQQFTSCLKILYLSSFDIRLSSAILTQDLRSVVGLNHNSVCMCTHVQLYVLYCTTF